MVEGTPLLRVQAGNRLEGSNPFVSATCPRESVLPIRLRLDFLVAFEGYTGGAEHRRRRHEARKRSLRLDILWTCCLRGSGEVFQDPENADFFSCPAEHFDFRGIYRMEHKSNM